jgi:transposase InsO family protein
MQIPRKQHRRRRLPGSSENSCIRHRAERMDHVWSYDFLMDRTEDGRQLKLLAVIDEYTRECLALEVSRSFTAQHVVENLQYLFAVRGRPEYLRSDNGPEFVARAVRRTIVVKSAQKGTEIVLFVLREPRHPRALTTQTALRQTSWPGICLSRNGFAVPKSQELLTIWRLPWRR